jgi:bifunctional UDP-N-acetylglucosamine pyrophosphorylase/glucosamine-1-phosphate N-acetyltransferase
MAEHIGRAMRKVGVSQPVMVIGYQAEIMKKVLGDGYSYAVQEEQLGTGHAVLAAKDFFQKHEGPVLIAPGDAPLLSDCILQEILDYYAQSEAKMVLATTILQNPRGYGRIVRDAEGKPNAIIEEKDADAKTREIQEICTGVYCIESKILLDYLPRLRNQNAQGEYYLTELVRILSEEKLKVDTLCFEDSQLFMGVNDRWQLAEASANMRQRILHHHALAGVTIVDPQTTYVGVDVVIAPDTVIEPMTILEGTTRIGSRCSVGPYANIVDSILKDECVVLMSYLNGATLRKGSRCGPYAHLRPGAVIGEKSKVGNYVEIKNAQIGSEVSVAHLTYIGDATIGNNTNIGAGTITCNYDGITKHRTEIGENVFVGSNTTLIAPLKIAKGAIVGAGSVVSKDVPEDALAIGRSRQEIKELWAQKWRRRKRVNN